MSGLSFVGWLLVAAGLAQEPTPFVFVPPFDRHALMMAVNAVKAAGFDECKKPGGPTGSGHVRVLFAPTGKVESSIVDQPPFAGTTVGTCVANKFRQMRIPEFAGLAVPAGAAFVVK
jgi:hypothetical protein